MSQVERISQAERSPASIVLPEQATMESRDAAVEFPSGVLPLQFRWGYGIWIVMIHLVALLALVPWFFSWTGVALAVGGFLVFHLLGINLAYHRLLTHQGFVCPKWLEYTFTTLGICCLQDTPARWVAIHRVHHQHSDDTPDPHTPLVNFLWSHVGWILFHNREQATIGFYDRYAKDILRDPYYLWCERGLRWLWIYLGHAAAYFLVALATMWIVGGDYWRAVQFGASVLVWGVAVRTVLVWEITWSVNSVTHVWGYRNYRTRDNSRNNWLIGILALGEGWHNNHHAEPRCVAHGHRMWEFDPTYLVIRALEAVGLAKDLKTIPKTPTVPLESGGRARE